MTLMRAPELAGQASKRAMASVVSRENFFLSLNSGARDKIWGGRYLFFSTYTASKETGLALRARLLWLNSLSDRLRRPSFRGEQPLTTHTPAH